MNGCNGSQWVMVMKIVKISGQISVGVNGDTKPFMDYDDDP